MHSRVPGRQTLVLAIGVAAVGFLSLASAHSNEWGRYAPAVKTEFGKVGGIIARSARSGRDPNGSDVEVVVAPARTATPGSSFAELGPSLGELHDDPRTGHGSRPRSRD